MGNKVLASMYDLWLESEIYHSESSLESEVFKQGLAEIGKLVEKQDLGNIADRITHIACDVETVAFEQGFRRGVLFMAEMMKGGVGDGA